MVTLYGRHAPIILGKEEETEEGSLQRHWTPPWPQGPLAPGQPLQGRHKDAQPGLPPSTGLGWEDAKERNGAAPSPGAPPV